MDRANVSRISVFLSSAEECTSNRRDDTKPSICRKRSKVFKITSHSLSSVNTAVIIIHDPATEKHSAIMAITSLTHRLQRGVHSDTEDIDYWKISETSASGANHGARTKKRRSIPTVDICAWFAPATVNLGLNANAARIMHEIQ